MMTAVLFCLTGCCSFGSKTAESLSDKNTNIDGYLFYGSGQIVSSGTAAPEAKVILGRISCKSRKVSIPENTKTPDTGSFKSTETKTLFGTEERILEYDFTASDPETALRLQQGFQQKILEILPE